MRLAIVIRTDCTLRRPAVLVEGWPCRADCHAQKVGWALAQHPPAPVIESRPSAGAATGGASENRSPAATAARGQRSQGVCQAGLRPDGPADALNRQTRSSPVLGGPSYAIRTPPAEGGRCSCLLFLLLFVGATHVSPVFLLLFASVRKGRFSLRPGRTGGSRLPTFFVPFLVFM